MTALITGATGFVGARLCSLLRETTQWKLLGLGRTAPGPSTAGVLDRFITVDLTTLPDLTETLRGVDVVLHLASRVHDMSDVGADALEAYRLPNVVATRHLAEQASKAGVKRFVFVSTIKVNGEYTKGSPFTGSDNPHPVDAYAQSKLEAEKELLELSRRLPLEVVLLRPPLVYGPGVRANFLSLMRLASRGLPLPLGSIRNRRSLLHVDNLCHAIRIAATSEGASNKIFTLSDDGAVSTAELIRLLSQGMGLPSRLWPFPVAILKGLGSLLGQGAKVMRLVESLEVDNTQFKRMTGWVPHKSTEDGLRETAKWFLTEPR